MAETCWRVTECSYIVLSWINYLLLHFIYSLLCEFMNKYTDSVCFLRKTVQWRRVARLPVLYPLIYSWSFLWIIFRVFFSIKTRNAYIIFGLLITSGILASSEEHKPVENFGYGNNSLLLKYSLNYFMKYT